MLGYSVSIYSDKKMKKHLLCGWYAPECQSVAKLLGEGCRWQKHNYGYPNCYEYSAKALREFCENYDKSLRLCSGNAGGNFDPEEILNRIKEFSNETSLYFKEWDES